MIKCAVETEKLKAMEKKQKKRREKFDITQYINEDRVLKELSSVYSVGSLHLARPVRCKKSGKTSVLGCYINMLYWGA